MEGKNNEPKDLSTAVDCAIRDKEREEEIECGYKVQNVTYCNYMSNETWKKFLNDMKPEHKKNFGDGKGGELRERTIKGNVYPPKMASFGSSSRFIYELSKDIKDFSFEKKLDTCVGGTANIDGFIKQDDTFIYVEAKLREIYGSSHNKQTISDKYNVVYDKIKKDVKDFDYETYDCDEKGKTKFTFKINQEEAKYFDLKQLICHFLGISYDLIDKNNIKIINVLFLYLLYNPKDIKHILQEKYNKYEDKVINRYNEVSSFITKNLDVFKEMFNSVLEFQAKINGKEKPEVNFEMKLVDQLENQNNYYKSEFQ